MRIGTSLYKVVRKPGLSGSMTKTIIQWSYGAIRQDDSKEYIINTPSMIASALCQITSTTNELSATSTTNTNLSITSPPRVRSFISTHSCIISLKSNTNWGWTTSNCSILAHSRSFPFCCLSRKNVTQVNPHSSIS